ncbi:hypothetical protein LINGRAPRIM_LOCUS2789, partial [Linum grandiflorum]
VTNWKPLPRKINEARDGIEAIQDREFDEEKEELISFLRMISAAKSSSLRSRCSWRSRRVPTRRIKLCNCA